MILGSGLIAKSLSDIDADEYIFFASGVSNSSENNSSNFKREELLLNSSLNEFSDKIFIYFSTVSLYFSSSEYINHKILMENLIINSGIKYNIFRLPQIVGKGGNPNNIINFLKGSIELQKEFNLNILAERSILDIDDLVKIIKSILDTKKYNSIFDIAGIEFKSVSDIVKFLEIYLNKKAIFKPISSNDRILKVNSDDVQLSINRIINDKDNYTEKIIKKYIN